MRGVMDELIQIEHKDRAHCEHGPSGAARWMNCPGSIKMSRGIPSRTSMYADEGTAAHELAEVYLRSVLNNKQIDPHQEARALVNKYYTPEMGEHVGVYVDHVKSLIDGADLVWLERRVSLARLGPPAPMDGTADCVILNDGVLHVIDLKYGQGVPVEVVDNPQLKMYGAAALLEMMDLEGSGCIEKVMLTIVQPRAAHPSGPIRSFVMEPVDLIDFAWELIDAAKATLQDDAPLKAGKHCRWCLALPQCPEARKTALIVAQDEFGAIGDTDVRLLTRPQVGALLYQFELVDAWMSSVRGFAQSELEAGREIPGMKLVERAPRRKWKDAAAAASWARKRVRVRDAFTPRELKSVAQLEKVVGRKKLPPDLIENVSSGLAMVEADDPRPAVLMLGGGAEFSTECA